MSIFLDFAIGRRVLCIDDTNWDRSVMTDWPVKGKVYTVRNASSFLIDDHLAIQFAEVISRPAGRLRPLGDQSEWHFQSRYFKPLDECRIDVFRSLLVKSHIWGGAQT